MKEGTTIIICFLSRSRISHSKRFNCKVTRADIYLFAMDRQCEFVYLRTKEVRLRWQHKTKGVGQSSGLSHGNL